MRDGKKYYTGAHTVYRLQYHLVWIPKYRKSVMVGEVATDLKRLFYQCAVMNGWWIERLAVTGDHVHMLVELTTQYLGIQCSTNPQGWLKSGDPSGASRTRRMAVGEKLLGGWLLRREYWPQYRAGDKTV